MMETAKNFLVTKGVDLIKLVERVSPADIKVFVGNRADYSAPSEKKCGVRNVEIILLPISIANDGGISGSIQQMTLEVQPEGSTSRRIFTSRGKSVPEAGECYKDKVFAFS